MGLFSIKRFLKSLKCASRGLISVYKTEQNFRFQIIIAIVVIIAMLGFRVTRKEAVLLILMIAFVLVMELINSVFEKIADMMKPRIHIYAKLIKDIMSGAVLITALVSLVIGVIIFIPYFVDLFNNLTINSF
jgi:diacylglycerol kinase